MDHALKIWQLDDDEMNERTKNKNGELDSNMVFRQHYPYYSTRDIHKNYVDSVKYFGDLIISKSSESSMAIWMPGSPDTELKANETKCTKFRYLTLPECEIW